MNKCVKALLITVAVIAIVAGVIYFLTRKTSCCDMEDCDCFDDDFDLDDDLKPADREYVPLNKTTGEAKEHVPADPLLNTEEKVVAFAEKANEKAADIFARASAKASDIADIANDKVSDFMNKTSDIIKNEKDYIKEKEAEKEAEAKKEVEKEVEVETETEVEKETETEVETDLEIKIEIDKSE